jgi:mono/diheme cytochrome c family protein
VVSIRSALALIALAVASPAFAGGVVTTADGIYSKAQAKSGEGLYEQHCLVCHDSKYFRPVLKRWHGQSAAVLFDVVVGSMPESNPGGLLDQEYLDILAYIFSRSRYPATDAPLKMADLPGITIEDP